MSPFPCVEQHHDPNQHPAGEEGRKGEAVQQLADQYFHFFHTHAPYPSPLWAFFKPTGQEKQDNDRSCGKHQYTRRHQRHFPGNGHPAQWDQDTD